MNGDWKERGQPETNERKQRSKTGTKEMKVFNEGRLARTKEEREKKLE